MLTQQVSVDPLFDHFNSEQHQLWKQHRLLRKRVPIRHIWRGCLGLATLLHDVECTEYPTDRHALLPNHAVSWLALRDIPRNHFPMCPAMHRRDVQYVTSAQATLRYGMPVVDFTTNLREAIDFRFMPFGCYQRRQDQYSSGPITARGDVLNSDEHPREFAVLNRLKRRDDALRFHGDGRTEATHPAGLGAVSTRRHGRRSATSPLHSASISEL